jgi:hypothetical protein
MSLDNFIPQVWSARLLLNLDKALVFAQAGVVNRDYEGEIRNVGDTVKINSIGRVSVKSYTKNAEIDAPEQLTSAQQSLLIDQGDYFNFFVDDVDAVQQRPKVMNQAMQDSAYELRDVVDGYIAGLHTDAAGDNLIGTDASPITWATADEAYEHLVDLSVKLDENNVPSGGRWAIVPPWFHGVLLKDDRFVKSGVDAGDVRLRNGMVGEAAGFSILKSNNTPVSSGDYKIIAGHPIAWSYASQITKTEAYRPEKRFADAVKGLHVYGAKVVRPSALAVLTITRTPTA